MVGGTGFCLFLLFGAGVGVERGRYLYVCSEREKKEINAACA